MSAKSPGLVAARKPSSTESVPLEAERARADALFQSIGDGAISTDSRGMITRINRTALDLLGFDRDELEGTWFPKSIVAVDENNQPLDIAERPITQAFLSGRPVSARAYYRRKDGTPLPTALTVSPYMLEGRPVGAVQVFRDITAELEIDRAKDEFISLASHQLRTPLTIIRTYSEMLSQGFGGDLNDRQSSFINAVNVSVIRMSTLINSLLSVARIESGQVHINWKKTNLGTILQSVLDEMKPRLNDKSLRLKLTIKPSGQVTTDPVLVKEIFVNLLSNAIKYSPTRGTIVIRLEREPKHIMFTISDSGYGIPKTEQDKVFSKFYRGSNILKRDTDGTGIGLYLVKRITENLGGDIWFKSREERGTTFYCTLPLKRPRG